MEQTNTTTILDNNQNEAPKMPSNTENAPATNASSISTLNDINPIPEFQNIPNKKNKMIYIVLIVVGLLVLGATGVYYWFVFNQNTNTETQATQTVDEKPAKMNETPETTQAVQSQPLTEVDKDPIINELDNGINASDSENIDTTVKNLESFDFQNIDLELQQNPGL